MAAVVCKPLATDRHGRYSTRSPVSCHDPACPRRRRRFGRQRMCGDPLAGRIRSVPVSTASTTVLRLFAVRLRSRKARLEAKSDQHASSVRPTRTQPTLVSDRARPRRCSAWFTSDRSSTLLRRGLGFLSRAVDQLLSQFERRRGPFRCWAFELSRVRLWRRPRLACPARVERYLGARSHPGSRTLA